MYNKKIGESGVLGVCGGLSFCLVVGVWFCVGFGVFVVSVLTWKLLQMGLIHKYWSCQQKAPFIVKKANSVL